MKLIFAGSLLILALGVGISRAQTAKAAHNTVTPKTSPPALNIDGDSEWIYLSKTDPMTDEHSDVFVERAKDGRHHETLFIRCAKDDQVDVYVDTDGVPILPPDSSFGTEVDLRLDRLPATHVLWLRSDDGHAMFAQSSIALLVQLQQHATLTLRWTPVDEAPQVATFYLHDLASQLSRHHACQWGD